MTNKNKTAEQSLLRRWVSYIAGGAVIVIIGFLMLAIGEALFDLSFAVLAVAAIAILIAVNLWGRRYGITKIFGR